MLDSRIRENLLVDELQLGSSLNTAITSGDRAHFALLLSMLSSDVTDDTSVVDPEKVKIETEDLRAKFDLLPIRSFYATDEDFDNAIIYHDLVDTDSRVLLNLSVSRQNDPLTTFESSLGYDVVNNMSPLNQLKAQKEQLGISIAREHYDLCTLKIVDCINESRDYLSAMV